MDIGVILLFIGMFFVLRTLTLCASNIFYSLTWKSGGYRYDDEDFDYEAAVRERNRLRVAARDRRFELGE